MNHIDPRQQTAILRVLRDHGCEVSSSEIAEAIQGYGFDVSARTVRLYLQRMGEDGLVEDAKRGRGGGRRITPAGLRELDEGAVLDRIGFTAAKVDRLAWQMQLDTAARSGSVVLNLTLIREAYVSHAIREMSVVFQAGLGVGVYAALLAEGHHDCGITVPAGHVGIGTVCSVTLNSLLLNMRVPTISRFGGVLELRDRQPARFTDLISYEGTTLDPLEIFIKAGLTDVHNAAVTGNGRIGVSFREIPTPALDTVRELQQELRKLGLDCILMIGKPNQPVLDYPVHEGRTGIIVTGGLNPAAAMQEAGIETTSTALCSLYDYTQLVSYRDLARTAGELLK